MAKDEVCDFAKEPVKVFENVVKYESSAKKLRNGKRSLLLKLVSGMQKYRAGRAAYVNLPPVSALST